MGNKVLEEILLYVIKRMITEEAVKAAKDKILLFLEEFAAKSENQVDDYVVQVIKAALGAK